MRAGTTLLQDCYRAATGLLQDGYKMATDLSVARLGSSTTSKNNSQRERSNGGSD